MLHDGTIVCFKSNKDNPIKYNNSKKVVTKCWKYTRILTNGTKYEYIGNPIKINPKTNKVTQYESFIQTDPNRPNVTPLEEGEKREGGEAPEIQGAYRLPPRQQRTAAYGWGSRESIDNG